METSVFGQMNPRLLVVQMHPQTLCLLSFFYYALPLSIDISFIWMSSIRKQLTCAFIHVTMIVSADKVLSCHMSLLFSGICEFSVSPST